VFRARHACLGLEMALGFAVVQIAFLLGSWMGLL
jgi:hypothetical protein